MFDKLKNVRRKKWYVDKWKDNENPRIFTWFFFSYTCTYFISRWVFNFKLFRLVYDNTFIVIMHEMFEPHKNAVNILISEPYTSSAFITGLKQIIHVSVEKKPIKKQSSEKNVFICMQIYFILVNKLLRNVYWEYKYLFTFVEYVEIEPSNYIGTIDKVAEFSCFVHPVDAKWTSIQLMDISSNKLLVEIANNGSVQSFSSRVTGSLETRADYVKGVFLFTLTRGPGVCSLVSEYQCRMNMADKNSQPVADQSILDITGIN